MMFLVLFSSLAAAMAVVAQSNLRTADSALSVSRAMSAAETGLVFAQRRLQEETRRFVVEEGLPEEQPQTTSPVRPVSSQQKLLELGDHPLVRRAGELFGAEPVRVDSPRSKPQ